VPADKKLRVAMNPARQDPAWVRRLLVGLTLFAVGFLIIIPVINVFAEAFAGGIGRYVHTLVMDPDTRHAIVLTFTILPFALVLNVVFGLAAAYAITRFNFRGRTVLTALIDLPFSVSPVVAGLMFVLIFGLQGYLGPFLRDDGYSIMAYVVAALFVAAALVAYVVFRPRLHPAIVIAGCIGLFAIAVLLQRVLGAWPAHKSLKIIFATPGLVLVTAFVTSPFVARELIPVMDAIGPEEDMAAISLGASGWQMFWHVTLPNVKWGLVYGVILCAARAMGEFGAVYVVSGRIVGQTDTMPLRIEKLFQDGDLPGSFALASLLTLIALVTLVVKSRLEREQARHSR